MTTMPDFGIAYEQSDNYHENARRTDEKGSGYAPCVICGKAVNVNGKHWMVRVHYGGSRIVTDQQGDRLNEMGFSGYELGGYPIGPDCLKKHPDIKPYAVRVGGRWEPDGLLAVPGFGVSQY